MEISNILKEVPVSVIFSFVPAIIGVIFVVIAAFFESKSREEGVLLEASHLYKEKTISNQRIAVMAIALAWVLSAAGSMVS